MPTSTVSRAIHFGETSTRGARSPPKRGKCRKDQRTWKGKNTLSKYQRENKIRKGRAAKGSMLYGDNPTTMVERYDAQWSVTQWYPLKCPKVDLNEGWSAGGCPIAQCGKMPMAVDLSYDPSGERIIVNRRACI